MAQGFLDRLTALAAERVALDEAADRQSARQRQSDYLQGMAAARDIIGRAGSWCSSRTHAEQTLREAAARQPDGLAGRVAAQGLSERAADIAPLAAEDRARQALAERIAAEDAALTKRWYEAARQRDREWHRDRER